MARIKGRFKKGPENEDSYKSKEWRRRVRRVINEEESTVGEALDEIAAEAEEFPVESDIEDELIELEGEGATGVAIEGTTQSLFNHISEKLKDLDAKMSRSDMVINTMKNESKQFQEQLTHFEEDMRKLLSIYEMFSARFNSLIDTTKEEAGTPEPVIVSEAEPPKEEKPVASIAELLPFKPYDSGRVGRPSSKGITLRREGAEFQTPREPSLPTFAVERKETRVTEPQKEQQPVESFKVESALDRETPTVEGKMPILTHINHDYLTLVLVMRWIEFLFERSTRDKISLVLDYYKDIGWISDNVKSEIMAYARGEMQDVSKYLAHEEGRDDTLRTEDPLSFEYKKVEDWRLSADDHLKSLLFIMKIANLKIDKDQLNSLEQMIQKFKESLEGFHGV